jgi:hypothetical protein
MTVDEQKDKNGSDFLLDESADALYRQFAGMDASDRGQYDADSKSSLMRLLNQQERLLDYYRLLLSEITCLFAGILENCHFTNLAEENNEKIKIFLKTIKKIADVPEFHGRIYGRLRGQQCPSKQIGSETYDYELSFNNFILDHQIAHVVAQREKGNGKALYGKLMDAFQALSAMNIFNFSIEFGEGNDEDLHKLETNIRLLMRFYSTRDKSRGFIIRDEYDQPNINLTLLAASHNIKPSAIQDLVTKIKPMITGPDPDPGLNKFTTVYDAIFASMQKRQQVDKLVIEVNSPQWLMQNLSGDPQREVEAVQSSRLILEKYGNNPRMASEVISSINSEGYKNIRSNVMTKRLSHATDFLNLAEKSGAHQSLQSKALSNIEDGLDHLPDEIYDSLSIEGTQVSTLDDDGQENGWSLHGMIVDLLSFFKRRSSIKKKVQDIANKDVRFDDEDYAVIAKNFKITSDEAAELIDLLRDCFDDNGNFRRNFFEKNIPAFLKHGSKVFSFLWHYLKELDSRKDRVAFLNALQPLAAGLKKPHEALNILLSDVFDRPETVHFSDRNALILGTVLLRHNVSSERGHIELTPEEVLKKEETLNQKMVAGVLNYFEQNNDRLIGKFRHIVEKLLELSTRDNFNEGDIQPRFLLYLIRELVIFLALIGGKSAQSIIHGVVEEFGDPGSAYYRDMKNKEDLRHSLQLLQVAARGLKRFDDPEGISLLGEITSREKAFIDLYDEPDPLNHVQRVMENILSSE